MTKLGDKARELVAIAEGEIQKREITIVALRREVEQLKKELAQAKKQQLTIRPEKCEGCAYRVVAMRVLDDEKRRE